VACGGKDTTLVLGNGKKDLQGAESIGSSPNGCGTASTSSTGSRRGPKHHQEAALCMGPVARV
jgi:hypothetical protein